jgi:serine/threonine protein kinase
MYFYEDKKSNWWVVVANKQIYSTAFYEYEKLSSIGNGGAGDVFEVKRISTGEIFALKLLSGSNCTGDRLKRFKNEVFFSIKNEHKGIISVVDFGFLDGNTKKPFYVMPKFPSTLRGEMSSFNDKEKYQYFLQLLNGVEAAHLQGVVHRDLKPENILIDKKNGVLVVADFGIAHISEKLLETPIKTVAAEKLANFVYASPEQRIKGNGDKLDERADIYALGLILNEMFTGSVPQGHDFHVIADYSTEYSYLDEVVSKMIQQNLDKRVRSIDEVKKLAIACGDDFIVRQRVNELDSTVVLESEVDITPVEVTKSSYSNGCIFMYLNQVVTRRWEEFARDMSAGSFTLGFSPESLEVSRDQISFECRESDVVRYVGMAKTYIEHANREYQRFLVRNAEVAVVNEKVQLRKQKEELEKTARINKLINE